MQSKAPQIRCQFTNHFSIPKKKMGAHTFIQFNNCGSLQLGFKYRKYYEKSTNHAIETLPQNGSVEALLDLCKQAINFVVVEGKKTGRMKARNKFVNQYKMEMLLISLDSDSWLPQIDSISIYYFNI